MDLDEPSRKPRGGAPRRARADPVAVPGARGADVNGTGLSDRIVLLLPDERSCLGALFALFAPEGPAARAGFVERIAARFDRAFADVVAGLLTSLSGELRADPVGIVGHACARLAGAVHAGNRRRLMVKLERVALEARRTDLAGLATLALIRRRLDAEFPLLERLAPAGAPADAPADGRTIADGRRGPTFDRMGAEFALLLSCVVDASGAPETERRREHARVLAFYTAEAGPRRRADGPGVAAELEGALQALYVQPMPIRRAFVQHCAEILGGASRGAAVTLEVLGAALGCEDLARPPHRP